MAIILKDIRGTFLDYPDNESFAISVFFKGCSSGCLDCHNQQLQKYELDSNSMEVSPEKLISLIEVNAYKNKTNKVVFMGGDPLYRENLNTVREVLKNINFIKSFDICVYTGYTIEYILHNNLHGFKFLKTGKYVRDLKQQSDKTDEYMQFASSNQKLYDSNYNIISKNGRYYYE